MSLLTHLATTQESVVTGRQLEVGGIGRMTVAGEVHLRYGWYDIVVDPCGTAGEVGLVLQRGGWDGTPQSCGPMCGLR